MWLLLPVISRMATASKVQQLHTCLLRIKIRKTCSPWYVGDARCAYCEELGLVCFLARLNWSLGLFQIFCVWVYLKIHIEWEKQIILILIWKSPIESSLPNSILQFEDTHQSDTGFSPRLYMNATTQITILLLLSRSTMLSLAKRQAVLQEISIPSQQ